MHLDGRSRLRLGTASNRLCRWLAVLFPATLAGSVFGQSYLAPPPGFGGAPAVPAMGNATPGAVQGNGQLNSQTLDQINTQANGPTSSTGLPANGQPGAGVSGTTTEGGKEVTAAAPVAAPLDALARWGAVHIHPHVSYQFLYATGIHNQPGNEADTYTQTVSPGVTIVLGPHATLDYTPSIRFFSEKDFHDTVDHSVNFHAGYNIGDWTLGVSQGVLIADEPLVATSSQVDQSNYRSGLLASYSVNDKLTLATTASLSFLDSSGGGTTNIFVGGPNGAAAQLTDSQDYAATETLDYKFNDKFSGGISASFGYTAQTAGFRSFEQNYGLHIGWHPAQKFSATVSGGFEERNFLDSETSSAWNPVYSVTLGYQLFEQTSLTLSANRSTDASIFDNQLTQDTSVGVALQQRLLGFMQLSLGVGYNKTDYESTQTADLSKSRGDDATTFTAGLTVPFLRRCSLAIFYQYAENSSSQTGFSYDSSSIGAVLSWSY